MATNSLSHLLAQDPILEWPVMFCFEVTVLTYVLSLLTGNVSQVDRLWTFLPAVYTAYYALLPLWPKDTPGYFFPYVPQAVPDTITGSFSPRALMMLTLVFIWMCRLSYNTWRRGLYNLKDEDYRWGVLRERVSPLLFQLINFTFIALAQNILLFLIGIPTKMAVTKPHSTLSLSDYILGVLGLLAVLLEFTSDNQQYSFQTFKRSGKLDANDWVGARIPWSKRDAERGFATRGLWAWSRHPNCLCEQAFWVIINLIPMVSPDASKPPASKGLITSIASLYPCLPYCLLFSFSTRFTESISLSKYPAAYAAYQQRVGMFLPSVTVLKGALLALQGKKDQIEEVVYGQGIKKTAKIE